MKINASGLKDELKKGASKRELTREFARMWYSESQDILLSLGDEHGYEVYPVVRSSIGPRWSEQDDAWVFEFPHVASKYFEFGTDEHEIRADDGFLKFPWPDAPKEVQEQFEDMWTDPNHWLERPEVLFKSVTHPGTPALRFLRDSREKIARKMQ